MSFGIRQWGTWESGYLTIAIIQILLIGILIITLPRWKSVNDVPADNGTTEHHVLTLKELIRLPGVKQTLIVIFGFSGIQGTMGLWISSYLVLVRKVLKRRLPAGLSSISQVSWSVDFFRDF